MASHLSRSARVWGSALRPCFAARPAAANVRYMGAAAGNPEDLQPIKLDIGKREIVGFGLSGEETYFDDISAPFPSIRFKEDIGEIATLREKEKGDWKKMTLAEKKTLYRASFCQTFAEMDAPTGDWKFVVAVCCAGVGLAFTGYLWINKYVYEPLPDTITDPEKVKAQIKRMIHMRVGPVEGFTSTYDYEKKEFKK